MSALCMARCHLRSAKDPKQIMQYQAATTSRIFLQQAGTKMLPNAKFAMINHNTNRLINTKSVVCHNIQQNVAYLKENI